VRIQFLLAGSDEWELLTDLFEATTEEFDLAVRSDGGWAASFVSENRVMVRTNVDPRNGNLESYFRQLQGI